MVAPRGPRLIPEIVQNLVRGVAVFAVAGFRGGKLKGEEPKARRAVPTSIGAVGIHRAVRRDLHREPLPEPLHSGVGHHPVVAEVLIAAGEQHEDGAGEVARVVRLHFLVLPEVAESQLRIPFPVRRLRDVRIPLRREAFHQGFRHRAMTASAPFDGLRTPDMNIAAIVQPKIAEPGVILLH